VTCIKTEWEWSAKHDCAFGELKRLLCSAPVMAYFQRGSKTRITKDESSIGLGAILEQEQEDKQWRPVYHAIRKLSHVESRYLQFEREALGVKWVCERFFLYFSGIEFDIRTDHKPLLPVLSQRSKPPSARLDKEIEVESAKDPTLKSVAVCITSGDFWVYGELVMRNNRIFQPA
jgi:hypothetical protein